MQSKQPANAVMLVRPANFGFNEETYNSNPFQNKPKDLELVQEKALKEFDTLIDTLKVNDIETIVFEDTANPIKPDAIFPNNWIALNPDGTMIIFPMETPNRKAEVRDDIIKYFQDNFNVKRTIDLRDEDGILEGTGSIVFDHDQKLAYTCRSSRSNESLLNELCNEINYKPIVFDAVDSQKLPIYHTNVMMCKTSEFTIICHSTIQNNYKQNIILNILNNQKQKIITIESEQMSNMCGNCLAVYDKSGNECLVMSTRAFQNFSTDQIEALSSSIKIIHSDIQTIENVGGGSARCMLIGIHC